MGTHVASLLNASHSFHTLTPNILPGENVRLVDPNKQSKTVYHNDPSNTIGKGKSVEDAVRDAFATGLFSMSEIAFDKESHYALVSFSFRCGSLCGSGATLVFEKVGAEWKKTDRNCGGWISYNSSPVGFTPFPVFVRESDAEFATGELLKVTLTSDSWLFDNRIELDRLMC
jgi:hypothetical protein